MNPIAYEIVNTLDRQGIIFQRIIGKDMLDLITKHLSKLRFYATNLAHIHRAQKKRVIFSSPRTSLPLNWHDCEVCEKNASPSIKGFDW